MAAPLRLAVGVEQDPHHLAPIRVIALRIEETQLQRHMDMAIPGQHEARWRFVEE
jgi:hypothetical protein